MNHLASTCTALLFVSIAVLPLHAQQHTAAEQEVLSIIDRFFGYMAVRDTIGMATILEAKGSFAAVGIDGNDTVPRMTSHAHFIAGLQQGTEVLLERYWDAEVRMDRSVAVVSCPYDFHKDGEFSHCGLDIFTLVKHPDGWHIAGAVFSMQREGCPPSPLGPVKK